MDRNQLEQEALGYLQRGNVEAALRAYQTILRVDPKDRRIRQKLAELLVRMGRPQDAERQFREVAETLVREGNHRAAVAVYKQLLALRVDDPQLHYETAEAYVLSGYPNDARQHLDQALRLFVTHGRTLDATRPARRLAEISPGEPALKVRLAELLEGGGDGKAALAVYREVIDEFRRRGRPDEVGRIAELALKLEPDDLGLLLDAAAARIEAGDPRKALTHLQPAFQRAPSDRRTLDLLARAFAAAGQADKALRVLAELVRVCAEMGDVAGEADALRRASQLVPDDPALRERLAEAEARMTRLERRLTGLVLSQPADEDELRAVVRAEVYTRYGFPDRAEGVLRQALDGRPDSAALLAALGETWLTLGRRDEAVRLMERLLPRAGAERGAVEDRIAVIRGVATAPPVIDETELVDLEDDAEAVTPLGEAPGETAEARGDRLLAAGDVAAALLAWREALAEDPMNEAVLGKIAALRTRARDGGPPVREAAPTPVGEGTYAEFDTAGDAGTGDRVHEARSLVEVGMYADAVPLVEDLPELEARVVLALALKGLGDTARAVDVLRDATNDAAETDAGYTEALFELSALYAVTGKHRAALRLLEELIDLDPAYRREAVDARLRGLQKVVR